MNRTKHFKPQGIQYHNLIRKREEMLCTHGNWNGWILYQHPDGQWVTLREASIEEQEAIKKTVKPRFA